MKIWLLIAVSLLTGCGMQPVKQDLQTFQAHKPRSIVVVPVVNESPEVTAPRVFMSTISNPLAEQGYYVFPVNLTELILKDLGLPEAGHIHQLPTQKLYDLFGADAALYVVIKDWSSKYLVMASTVMVTMEYILKDTKTGAVLWQAEKTAAHNSAASAGGGLASLIIMAASAALNAMATDYRPLAYQANFMALQPPDGLPLGPYHPNYGKDLSKVENNY